MLFKLKYSMCSCALSLVTEAPPVIYQLRRHVNNLATSNFSLGFSPLIWGFLK